MITESDLIVAIKTVATNRIVELVKDFMSYPWWLRPFKLWNFCIRVSVSLESLKKE